MDNNNYFHPPYLSYNDPIENLKIQNLIDQLKKQSAAKKIEHNKPLISNNIPNKIIGPKKLVHSNIKVTTKTLKDPIPNINSDISSHGIVENLITSEVVVNPNGIVSLGFNCGKTFTASNNWEADTFYWNILFKDISGIYPWMYYMGDVVNSSNEITFDLDYKTYAQSAYSNNGQATFKVQCQSIMYGMPGPFATSPEIILDFLSPNCISIQSVSLNTDSIVGGKNAPDPVLTVNLDMPAPPGGQKVLLSVSNSNLGNIMGSGYFVIPQGQTSGSQSWFLGTRRVYSTGKTLDIISQLEGNTEKAFATVKLRKQ